MLSFFISFCDYDVNMFTPMTSIIKCESKMFVASYFFDRDIIKI